MIRGRANCPDAMRAALARHDREVSRLLRRERACAGVGMLALMSAAVAFYTAAHGAALTLAACGFAAVLFSVSFRR